MTTQPRLFVVSELYYPEDTSTGYFLTRIAEGLAADFAVTAVCAKPTYAERGRSVPWREARHGVTIRRQWSTRFAKDRLIGRAANLLTFTLSTAFFCLVHFRRGDRVLLVTNPPTLPPLLGALARMRGARPSLLVHDVYPEALIAAGMLSPTGMVARLFRAAATETYRLFEHVVVLGRDMRDLVVEKMGRAERVTIIPNWGDVDEVMPMARADNPFAQLYSPSGATIIQHSGNIGRTHDIETLLEAVASLGDQPNVHFQIVGGGAKASLLQAGGHAPLAGLTLLPRQPREMLGPMLAAADAVIVGFVDGMLGISVPSRMYNVMAAGTALIALADSRSELAMVIAEEDCGWVLEPGNVDGLIALLEHLATPAGCADARRRGGRGRAAVIRRFSLPVVLDKFRALLLSEGAQGYAALDNPVGEAQGGHR